MPDVYLTLQPKAHSVAHQWRTSILSNVIGGEQRTALFTWPRVALRGEYGPAGSTEINWLKRNLLRKTDALWGVPVWQDWTILTAQAASGQKILAVADTTLRHFYEDRQCILINPASTLSYATGTIDILAAQQITLTVNLAAAWPAGTWVLPLYDCRINQLQEAATLSSRVQTWELEATESFEAARAFSYTLPASGADTYLDLDLFLPFLHAPATHKYSRPYDILQYLGMGYALGRLDTGENAQGLKGKIFRSTRAGIWEILNFFDAHMGRLQPFWAPSWNRDLVATAAIDAADTVIAVEDIEYATHYLTNEVIGRHVFIRFPDKSYICRKITAAGSSTSITLDTAIGTSVPAGQLKRLLISFLNLSRFDIDELRMEYPTGSPETAEMEISMAGIVEQAVEE